MLNIFLVNQLLTVKLKTRQVSNEAEWLITLSGIIYNTTKNIRCSGQPIKFKKIH